MELYLKTYQKVLFIGTGGGNDVFSTILAALSLQRTMTWESCAIAGVLSPFHIHKPVQATAYPGVVEILPTSKRYVQNKKDCKEISFVDATVAALVDQGIEHLAIEKVYGLSLRQGSQGVKQSLITLHQDYDYIVLVDVGGDILYRGEADTHIQSPMFDAIVLKGFVEAGVPGVLFEAGPGTDGEIDYDILEKILFEQSLKRTALMPRDIWQWQNLYQDHISAVRPGHTVPMTIKAFYSDDKFLQANYRIQKRIGEKKYYHNITQTISTRLCLDYYLLDPGKINNPFAVDCLSPMDWFVLTQAKKHRTNNEANMQYYDEDGIWWQILTPSPLFSVTDRISLILSGLQSLSDKDYDIALMWENDWGAVKRDFKSLAPTGNPRKGMIHISKIV